MSKDELDLYCAFIRHGRNYLEFGAGGSTFIASKYISNTIVSVDSSREWVDKVASTCGDQGTRPHMLHVDIGPTGEWGYPTDQETRSRWPDYHENVWQLEGSDAADLYMVDGRFRVACFAQIVLHCPSNAIILIHDFQSRSKYHCVHAIARQIASAEDMAAFLPLKHVDVEAQNILSRYRFDPD